MERADEMGHGTERHCGMSTRGGGRELNTMYTDRHKHIRLRQTKVNTQVSSINSYILLFVVHASDASIIPYEIIEISHN